MSLIHALEHLLNLGQHPQAQPQPQHGGGNQPVAQAQPVLRQQIAEDGQYVNDARPGSPMGAQPLSSFNPGQPWSQIPGEVQAYQGQLIPLQGSGIGADFARTGKGPFRVDPYIHTAPGPQGQGPLIQAPEMNTQGLNPMRLKTPPQNF